MKKQTLSLLAAVLLLCGLTACGSKCYRLTGTVTPADTTVSLQLLTASGANIDTIDIDVKDGHFALEGAADTACMAVIYCDGNVFRPLVLEKGDIHIDIDFNHPDQTRATGTPLNETFNGYMERLVALYDQIDSPESEEEQRAKLPKLIDEIVEKHASDPVGYYFFMVSYFSLNDSVVMSLAHKLEPRWKNDREFAAVLAARNKQAATAEGKPFVDFAVDYEGTTTRLSDYVGRGQYVLVDFWASWCGPCRGEIPNLINAYQQYKDKGLVVLGVATWDKPEDTHRAIDELGIPYPQILNAQAIGSDAYGIEAIPEIILFGPDGTILRRTLRGEEIGQALADIYSK